ncbi:MAG: enoyl-CoA hydratase/isomerase family protein [Dehalococcoidia bacterium]
MADLHPHLEYKRVDFTKIIYEKKGNIAYVTLNDPEHRNVTDWPGQGGITDQFYLALDDAEFDDDVKVVVIRGAGKDFQAGHDLNEVGYIYGMGTGQKEERRASQRIRYSVDKGFFHETQQKILLHPKITICQCHGNCLGSGVYYPLLSDLAVAASDAKFATVEQRLGFAGSGSQVALLMATIGIKRALGMLLTGAKISGEEAARIGLVTKAVPPEDLEEETNKMAESMALLPRDGIAIGKATRRLIYEQWGLTNGLVYISHTMFTNLRWEPDEYNFFKERRNRGTKEGFKGRDERYTGKTESLDQD